MPNYNKVMLMGNLTRDPELRYLPSNMPVVQIGMAINRRWRSKEGENQDETNFVECEAFGRTAEVINEYLKKGRPLFIEGRLKLDQWQDKEGNNRSKMKVIIETFQFVDSRGDGDGGGSGGGGGGRRSYGDDSGAARGRSRPAPASTDEPHEPIDEDDIPF